MKLFASWGSKLTEWYVLHANMDIFATYVSNLGPKLVKISVEMSSANFLKTFFRTLPGPQNLICTIAATTILWKDTWLPNLEPVPLAIQWSSIVRHVSIWLVIAAVPNFVGCVCESGEAAIGNVEIITNTAVK